METYYFILVVPDWKALLAFFLIALTAFVAPALGYQMMRPQRFLGGLYLLIGVLAVDCLIYYFAPVRVEEFEFARRNEGILRLLYLARVALFGGALLMFVAGLQSLKRGDKCPLATPTETDTPANGEAETGQVQTGSDSQR